KYFHLHLTKNCIYLLNLGIKNQSTYNEALARELGADEYGMKQYWMVFLKTGSNTTADTPIMQKAMSSHMQNIHNMSDAGILVAAGPFGKNQENYRGVYIFEHLDESELRAWLQKDNAVEIGIFSFEILPWYGSAALPKYLDYHKQIEKTKP
ncbi:MAG: YciI family protein, partial [Weeksellaceae bacterium]|nr:YciI family protein [Weeksellaceae bacterium]